MLLRLLKLCAVYLRNTHQRHMHTCACARNMPASTAAPPSFSHRHQGTRARACPAHICAHTQTQTCTLTLQCWHMHASAPQLAHMRPALRHLSCGPCKAL